jgi:GNAT superfamily N-acetyltransferase/ketosteroid isomerase-like protein
MADPESALAAFIAALNSNATADFDRALTPDCGFRAWRADGRHQARPRERVVRWLQEERAGWHEAHYTVVSTTSDGDHASIEFNVQVSDAAGRELDYARMAACELSDGKIAKLHLYCTEPVPGAIRDRIMPADLSAQERAALLEGFNNAFDPHRPIEQNGEGLMSAAIRRFGSRQQHPGTNFVMGVHWSEQEAEDRIEELIEWHRRQDIGFQWIVGPWDSPANLGARLERHGFAHAGDQALMARFGLADLDIPTNPDLVVQELDGNDEDAIEAALQITGVAFHWPKEQIDNERDSWFAEVRNGGDGHRYLARLDGLPVGEANLYLKAGVAHLGGAATLPEYRNQKVYSSLLRRRLETARAAGYNIATIHAEPMSRRVVARYGFETQAMFDVYAWMPLMDPAVIATLVQDD